MTAIPSCAPGVGVPSASGSRVVRATCPRALTTVTACTGRSASRPLRDLRPERPWEGADVPNEPSVRSVAYGLVNQLRDPAIHLEGSRAFLVYAFGGESGLAIAELIDDT